MITLIYLCLLPLFLTTVRGWKTISGDLTSSSSSFETWATSYNLSTTSNSKPTEPFTSGTPPFVTNKITTIITSTEILSETTVLPQTKSTLRSTNGVTTSSHGENSVTSSGENNVTSENNESDWENNSVKLCDYCSRSLYLGYVLSVLIGIGFFANVGSYLVFFRRRKGITGEFLI